jgi:hypothetical protein
MKNIGKKNHANNVSLNLRSLYIIENLSNKLSRFSKTLMSLSPSQC